MPEGRLLLLKRYFQTSSSLPTPPRVRLGADSCPATQTGSYGNGAATGSPQPYPSLSVGGSKPPSLPLVVRSRFSLLLRGCAQQCPSPSFLGEGHKPAQEVTQGCPGTPSVLRAPGRHSGPPPCQTSLLRLTHAGLTGEVAVTSLENFLLMASKERFPSPACQAQDSGACFSWSLLSKLIWKPQSWALSA